MKALTFSDSSLRRRTYRSDFELNGRPRWIFHSVLKMSTATPSLGHPLLGQTRGQILALLLGAPDESFFPRQIARQIETSVGTVQRELTRLAHAGLIVRFGLGQPGLLPSQ